jgi:hypothetical protein
LAEDQSGIRMDGDEPVRSMLPTMTDNMLQGRLPKWFLLFFLLGACTAPSTDSLVGRYEAKLDYGTETLWLRPNGTYEQNLTVAATGEAIAHSGQWKYDQSNASLTISDPLQFDDNFGRLNPHFRIPVSGDWKLDVRGGASSIALAWNDDLGVEFRRKE